MVTALAFTNDGELVSASLDDQVLQWTLTTAEPSARLLGKHGSGARALAIGSDGAIASGGADGAVVLHRTGKQSVMVGRHRVAVNCLRILSPDVLLSGDARGDLGVWQRLGAEDFRGLDREVVRGGGGEWIDSHDCCVLLTHHPPSWLTKVGREILDSEIKPDAMR